jgi:hypothetical protein
MFASSRLSRSGVSAVQLLHLVTLVALIAVELVPYIRHEVADMLFCCNAHNIRGDPETPAVGKMAMSVAVKQLSNRVIMQSQT